uniref:Lipase maturation factor n=3 Tax=Bos TaxID=9903 RepID=A0A4W2BZ77_BOBOX
MQLRPARRGGAGPARRGGAGPARRGGAGPARRGGAGPARRGGAGRTRGSCPARRVADMAGSRVPRQLFLQGVAAVFMFAFASLYTQIPGLYGPEGILPARRTLRPQGKGRWQQLWETPTLLWEAPLLGLDTAQGLELLSLLGTVLALGALLTRQLRHPLVYLLLWAAYLSVCQVGQVFLYFQWDSLLLETGFLAMLVAPLGLPPNHKQAPQGRPGGVSPHEGLPFWLVRWLLFRLMFASGVVKLTSRCPAWWGLTALTYHYETQCLPTPAAWFAHHLPVWLHKLSVVATFLIEIAVPPLFFAPVRRLRLAAFYSQVLLQVLIILTGNYNFFNLLTLVLTTALLDDTHLAAKSSTSRRKRMPSSWPKALLAMLTLLLELAVYGLLACGVVHYFGLEVDWEQHVVRSRTMFTFHQLSQWLKTVTLPTMWLGAASLAWELLTALWRWVQVRGSLRKLCAAVQLSVFGTATVALFLISLVPYSYMEPSSHGRLWTGAHRLFSTVEHLQLANSYGLFRRMTGLGGRPEVVLEGSYDGHQWTEIEFMYKPGNLSRPPPIVVPHQPRLDWQMWFAALGPHTHSPWFTSLVLRLLQGKEPVIRLVQNHVPSYPFHQQPPTYVRAQLYKYWFSHPWEQGQWWRRQWVEEFFPSVSLGDPALDMLLRQFGLQDKSPPRAGGSSNTLSQALHWVRKQLSPLEAPALLWGLLGAVGAIKVMQALLGPQSLPRTKEEKHKPAPQEDSVAASKQASPAPNISSGSQTPRRKKSP